MMNKGIVFLNLLIIPTKLNTLIYKIITKILNEREIRLFFYLILVIIFFNIKYVPEK